MPKIGFMITHRYFINLLDINLGIYFVLKLFFSFQVLSHYIIQNGTADCIYFHVNYVSTAPPTALSIMFGN